VSDGAKNVGSDAEQDPQPVPDMRSRDRRSMARLRVLSRLKRSLRKRYLHFLHGDRPFVTEYMGARFLVRWTDVIGREIALQNYELTQLGYMQAACARIEPDAFIDVGANSGVYSCILLNEGLVPRAILFEPDARNYTYLRSNLAINDLLPRADCRQEAVGAAAGTMVLRPGPESNTGTSRAATPGERASDDYPVAVVVLDDAVSFRGMRLAIKLDVEGAELEALSGMERTLRENRGIVQIEAIKTRDKVVRTMRDLGYDHVEDFFWDQVFEKR
jgi:FkbM family methyltransferase